MKHWGASEVDSTNLISYFALFEDSLIFMSSRQIQKKRHRFRNQRDYKWSTGYTTYEALNILHEALGGQWGRFYNSGSYFADSPIILMGLSAKNKKRHRFRI